jgi:hypothetical protein
MVEMKQMIGRAKLAEPGPDVASTYTRTHTHTRCTIRCAPGFGHHAGV